ncbi:MAG: MerR family transcriptional regulator [Polaromonas sp.]|uniref:MerR family transcriptional regulator n=1 Tax=Polaromonas sp. TaxID=1869339 RepID=UPI00271FA102|nr:MerR family transcriptional regulator [Polaromonas sp.]MDO9116249.1 MerR family transcriptional regulator [Polaromonas sp.]MDP1887094.1 MerR family transcriptional regulator [Polaromonas sp.]MDP3222563.1 MerR family transcriptional regulator [Rubrivivax sp.]
MDDFLTIAAVAEETGIAKEVLRKWETRYGFPLPGREASGVRLYPAEQARRLKIVKRLLDDGMRPGQIVALDEPRLMALLATRSSPPSDPQPTDFSQSLIRWLQTNDPRLLRDQLHADLMRRGLRDFVLHAMPALNESVGDAWSRGEISISHEHLYTETVLALVRQGMSEWAGPSGPPRVLLTTPPGELHTLGILMVEALMSLEGATCISLGAQTPLPEIVSASQAYQADIVGLSFGPAFPRKKILPFLRELRSLCPGNVEVWAGGSGVARTEMVPRGVSIIPTLKDALTALQRYRKRSTTRVPAPQSEA